MDYMIREEVVLSVKNPSLKSVWLLRPDNYHKMIVACFGLLVGGKSRASCLFINARARARTQVRQAGRLAGQTGRQTRQACTRLRFFPLPLSISFASSEPDADWGHALQSSTSLCGSASSGRTTADRPRTRPTQRRMAVGASATPKYKHC